LGKDFKLMVDANHAYNLNDALYVGRGLDELDIFWFEEPVAPEDYDGYRELKQKINTNIAGGEAEFTKYGWNELIKKRCIDIAQPEVCGLGGITEYLKVSALAQANFIPVINHVWGSAVSIATNLHLLTAQPDMLEDYSHQNQCLSLIRQKKYFYNRITNRKFFNIRSS
jgi:D-galactarolactone cycloisomerase